MTPLQEMTWFQEFEVFFWMVTGVGAVATAILAILNYRKDLRWRKAQAARDFIHEMHEHEVTKPAIYMLDWLNSRTHSMIETSSKAPCISRDDLFKVASGSDEPITDYDLALECLDWWFYYIDRMEQHIRDGFFKFEHVKYIFLPYYQKFFKHPEDRDVFERFSINQGYVLAPHFWERFI
jgi:hypothetical protein